ncbi:hypothetical protein CCP3SC15_330017 [Gammaproteobacteria bacterium]
MRTDGLLRLQTGLMQYQPLLEWSQARYQKNPSHALFLERPANTNGYPFIGYVVVREHYLQRKRVQEIALIHGVANSEIRETHDEQDNIILTPTGALELSELGEHLLAFLGSVALGGNYRVESPRATFLDLETRHPLYRAELDFRLHLSE